MGLLRSVTARCHRLPSFLLVGAQKAGTTSFFAWLCAHPWIVPPKRKELHFFDSERRYRRGMVWYRRHFPSLLRCPPPRRTGEATPKYLFAPLVPRRVAEALPGVRALVLLRDPVARAYSHYHHERRTGRERRPFHEAVGAERERLERSPPTVEGPADGRFAPRAYLERGVYAPQLERWFGALGRDRVAVWFAEEFFADPVRVLGEAQDFLGLPRSAAVAAATLGGARNRRAYPPLDAECAAQLRRWFVRHDEALAALLGREPPWRAPHPPPR